jgi:hypothetical protein
VNCGSWDGQRDLVVYDLETAVIRRVTEPSGSYQSGTVHRGWLVYAIGITSLYKDVRAKNLRRAGLIDEFDHVVPE